MNCSSRKAGLLWSLKGEGRMSAGASELLETIYEMKLFKRLGNLGTPRKLRIYLERLFRGVPLQRSRVLDVGAGTGVFSFWMAASGAASVTSIEPQLEGSHDEMANTFCRLKHCLSMDNVGLERTTFQNLDTRNRQFDVILMHNSINHLDEDACRRLPGADAVDVYRSLFDKCSELTKAGGTIVIADCSRHNFFGALGLRNPLAPTIDWRVHQSPYVWRRLLMQSGYSQQRLSWSTIGALGRPGALLLDNVLAAYFLLSHFSLVMRRD